MTRTKKVLGVLLILIALGFIALGVAISRNAPCVPVPALTKDATPMKAIVHTCYGAPDVLSLADIAKPTPADDEVLVKVHAASVNPLDWHYLRGEPYIMRMEAGFGKPKNTRMGVDFA